jgi:hypothetical protein
VAGLHHSYGHLLQLRLSVASDDFQHESVLPYKIARGSVDRDEAITSGARK